MGKKLRLKHLVVGVGIVAFVAAGGTYLTLRPDPIPTGTSTTTALSTVPSSTWTAVWPSTTSAVRFKSPTAATRDFCKTFLQMKSLLVGKYQSGDGRSGEVPVQTTPNGPITTVMVRQLTSDESWWVLGAATADIVIQSPQALSLINSPLHVSGSSTAFEAVLNGTLREDRGGKVLAAFTTLGGANGTMGPFSRTVMFPAPNSHYGSLVLTTRSAKDGSISSASVLRLTF